MTTAREVPWSPAPTVDVRPLRDADADQVAALYLGAGSEALHDRFFTVGRRVAEAHLADLGSPTAPRCLVAVAAGRVVGIVEMAPVTDHAEEIALLVATGMHHHGIGTALTTAAVDDARARGVRSLVAEVLATNHLMLEVFVQAGATLARTGSEVAVTLPLTKERVHA